MVSFQCDGCSDVVKKPKLDQHHSRGCGSSFTCIDCSKTFQTPADWKGHTSCITEAQKYQKALYKPKLNGGGREHCHQAASNGKLQGGWNRPPTRWQATGANGTPLGTPSRMSPVTISPPLENEQKSVPASTVGKCTGSKPERLEKAHKKRKPEGVDVKAIDAPTEVDPCPEEKLETKEKKAKKEKRNKFKKSKGTETTEIATCDVEIRTIPLSQKSLDVVDSDIPKKSKKRKKENKHKESTAVGAEVAISDPVGQATSGDQEERDVLDEGKKKKKKKHKSEMPVTGPEPNGDVTFSAPDASIPPPEKKSKKRKRETKETEFAKGVGETEIEKKIKKKRASTG